jgi:hypothetical protein
MTDLCLVILVVFLYQASIDIFQNFRPAFISRSIFQPLAFCPVDHFRHSVSKARTFIFFSSGENLLHFSATRTAPSLSVKLLFLRVSLFFILVICLLIAHWLPPLPTPTPEGDGNSSTVRITSCCASPLLPVEFEEWLKATITVYSWWFVYFLGSNHHITDKKF